MNPAPQTRLVNKVMHQPLEWLQVDRRVCMVAWLSLALVLNLLRGMAGILGGLVAFLVVYSFGWWLKFQDDPAFLRLLVMPSCANWYDAGKHDAVEVDTTC